MSTTGAAQPANSAATRAAAGGGGEQHPEPLTSADRLQLRALSDRYATAVDARDLSALQACFLEDGLLRIRSVSNHTHEFRGHAGLGEIFEQLAPMVLTMHEVSTWSLTESAPPAAVLYCCAHHISIRDDGASDLVMQIRYEDRYARDHEREWRLRERFATVLFTERRAVRLASD